MPGGLGGAAARACPVRLRRSLLTASAARRILRSTGRAGQIGPRPLRLFRETLSSPLCLPGRAAVIIDCESPGHGPRQRLRVCKAAPDRDGSQGPPGGGAPSPASEPAGELEVTVGRDATAGTSQSSASQRHDTIAACPVARDPPLPGQADRGSGPPPARLRPPVRRQPTVRVRHSGLQPGGWPGAHSRVPS